MSLERAILLVVGLVVVGSLLLGIYQSPSWFWVTGLMGAHLYRRRSRGCARLCDCFRNSACRSVRALADPSTLRGEIFDPR